MTRIPKTNLMDTKIFVDGKPLEYRELCDEPIQTGGISLQMLTTMTDENAWAEEWLCTLWAVNVRLKGGGRFGRSRQHFAIYRRGEWSHNKDGTRSLHVTAPVSERLQRMIVDRCQRNSDGDTALFYPCELAALDVPH